MGRGVPKDLFICHTKSKEADRKAVDTLVGLLLPARYKIWGYKDWDWYKKEPSWLEALAYDEPRLAPFREVDEDRLEFVLSRTRAVIILYPSDNCLSEGMEKELLHIRRPRLSYQLAIPYLQDNAGQIVIRCAFERKHDEGFLVENMEYDANLPILLQEEVPDSKCIVDITVVIATLLLKQRIQYIDSLPGDEEDILSKLFGPPKKEIDRASRILERAQGYAAGRAYVPLVQHTEELRDLLGRCKAKIA